MRHTRTIRLSHTEEKVIQAAAALTEVGTSVFLRAAGLAAAAEVVAASRIPAFDLGGTASGRQAPK